MAMTRTRRGALLAEAGWVDANGDGVVEKDGQELRFELIYESGQATVTLIVTYFQDAWRAIGVAMTPVSRPFPALVEALTTFDYAMGVVGFDWDASGNQYTMFNCDQYGVGFNLVKYCNPDVDELNNAARRELDREKRIDLLIRAQDLVNEDLPVGTFETTKGGGRLRGAAAQLLPRRLRRSGPRLRLGRGMTAVSRATGRGRTDSSAG